MNHAASYFTPGGRRLSLLGAPETSSTFLRKKRKRRRRVGRRFEVDAIWVRAPAQLPRSHGAEGRPKAGVSLSAVDAAFAALAFVPSEESTSYMCFVRNCSTLWGFLREV